MPVINILKVNRPTCDYCGKCIEDTYCDITLIKGKVISFHKDCASHFANDILAKIGKEQPKEDKGLILPCAHKGVDYYYGRFKKFSTKL